MMNANNNFEMMELNDQDLENITGGKGCFGNHGSFLYRLLFDDKNKNVLLKLLKAIVFYQRVIIPARQIGSFTPTWSDAFICNTEGWEVCPQRADSLINQLIPEGISQDDIDECFASCFTEDCDMIKIFPGKMLKTSLHRFIRTKIQSIGNKSLNTKFANFDTAYELLTAHLHKSPDLKNILLPVKNFVE